MDTTVSWLEGGFGRFDQGSDPNIGNKSESFFNLDAQLALDWHLSDRIFAHLHILARSEQAKASSEDLGLVEAFTQWRILDDGTQTLAASAGLKFFPSSLENTDDLWQSPYTLTYSAWNSWVAHEFRPVGLQLNYTYQFESGAGLGLVANGFVGNDSSGAELAWGGWRHSQRLTTLGEVLPLPDLVSLRPGNNFEKQRRDGSKPFGPDLDDNIGYAVQLNFSSQRFHARLSHVDNNGDRQLYRGEYAWATSFTTIGLHYELMEQLTLLGEYTNGETGMGFEGRSVDVDFETAYLLLSFSTSHHRISARFETFEITDTDGVITDNSEDGESFTLAYFYSPGSWRFGVEYLETRVDRIAALQSGFSPNHDGKQTSLEVRYVF